jgi:hypothetical protein
MHPLPPQTAPMSRPKASLMLASGLPETENGLHRRLISEEAGGRLKGGRVGTYWEGLGGHPN